MQPSENRFANQKMSDIELDDLGQCCNRTNGVERKAMAGMNLKPEIAGQSGPAHQPFKLAPYQ